MTFTGRPIVSGDDGYIQSVATFNNNAAFIAWGQVTGMWTHSWIRVPNVIISPGADIISAVMTCKAWRADVGLEVYANIYMNDHDDAVAPTVFAEYGALDLTTAFTPWDLEPAWVIDTLYYSPNFKDSVQEVVDRANWLSGNAMMILVKDDGSDNNAIRLPDSQDLAEGTAVLFTVEWAERSRSIFI